MSHSHQDWDAGMTLTGQRNIYLSNNRIRIKKKEAGDFLQPLSLWLAQPESALFIPSKLQLDWHADA
ncbi:hypothetical protein SAMN05421690_1001152 [Nitrosomonas sp. Nm51]|uniref:hypothetical protein n=1 Tax=Nitrosomonas sp. Nm51 TaxID=133720 RepID=UPI0008CC3DE9|nr:hypothetical protein [Nitrosomonas sp. Nm51]SEQ78782.1 hypothetical protein SAMN05421690_1001152 [Nitrosomonas sp. Nm51]